MKPEFAIDARLAEASQLFCTGQVSAVPGNKVTVTTLGGASITIPRLSTWTPVNGDVVIIAKTPGGWIALGKVA
ncbi:MAG TPA: hypothetical protein VFX53_17150 [Pedococcus sp.]|nr:hypothetical protein [Pedococcus sp.]